MCDACHAILYRPKKTTEIYMDINSEEEKLKRGRKIKHLTNIMDICDTC